MSLAMTFSVPLFALLTLLDPRNLVEGPVPSTELKVTLSLGKKESVHAVFQNDKAIDVRVNKQVIYSAILALEIRDGAGKRVATVPPPTPSRDTEYVVIPAGKQFSVSYAMEIFSPPLEAGLYRVQVRIPNWKSNELEYKVRKKLD